MFRNRYHYQKTGLVSGTSVCHAIWHRVFLLPVFGNE